MPIYTKPRPKMTSNQQKRAHVHTHIHECNQPHSPCTHTSTPHTRTCTDTCSPRTHTAHTHTHGHMRTKYTCSRTHTYTCSSTHSHTPRTCRDICSPVSAAPLGLSRALCIWPILPLATGRASIYSNSSTTDMPKADSMVRAVCLNLCAGACDSKQTRPMRPIM